MHRMVTRTLLLTQLAMLLTMLARPLTSAAQDGAAGTPTAEIVALRAELARLKGEMNALRDDVALLRQYVTAEVRMQQSSDSMALPVLRHASWQPFDLPGRAGVHEQAKGTQAAPDLEMLKAQGEEQAQSPVESSTRLPLRLSGTVLANTFLNSGEANWLENPNLVAAAPPGGATAGSMSATVRQSRVGFEIGTMPVGSWTASGAMMVDFFGGVPNFQNGTVMGLPRLLYAFGRLETDRTAIHVGQDHVLLAPRDPTSLAALSFPLFFRSGNLHLRAPQARVERSVGAALTLAGGIVAPIAGDFSDFYEFAPAAGAGERSKRPALQGRAEFGRGNLDDESGFSIGGGGQYGWRRVVQTLDPSWAVAVDANVRVGRFGLGGEVFRAENGEALGAALSQAGSAFGGWIEARVALSARLDVNAGVGVDRPEEAALGRLVRQENRGAFGNLIFRLTPEVATSLEYCWLETRAGLIPVNRVNHHVNAVFAVKF